MHLAIYEDSDWSNRIFWIKNISLKDGALPTISDQSANIIGLEPAVWAKVSVLDVVFIDIGNKVLHWTTCRANECPQRKDSHGNNPTDLTCQHFQSVMIESDEIILQCDFDELLRIASDALYKSPQSPHLLWHIFRLLHLYVLPMIQFRKGTDERAIDRALEKQNKILREIEKLLDEKSEERGAVQKSLSSKRQSICSKLEQDKFNLEAYCDEFITILEGGIKEDLKSAFTEIDKYCYEVEQLTEKQKRAPADVDYSERLNRIKMERDEYMVHLSRALVVREEIENYCRTSTQSSPKEIELPGIQREYIEEAEHWKLLSNLAEKLFWTKIHAVSIREALSFMQLELKFSTDRRRSNAFSIKVMGRDSIPSEWQTIDEQVTKALERDQTVITLHQSGKASLQQLCLSLLHDKQEQVQTERTLQRKGGFRRKDSINKLNSCKQAETYEQRVDLFCSSFLVASPSEMFAAVKTKVCGEIASHFEKITSAFLLDSSFQCDSKPRLWISYEKFLFPDLLFHYIIPIYQRAHQNELTKLKKILSEVTVKTLGLEGEVKLLKCLGLLPDSSNKDGEDRSGLHSNAKADLRNKSEDDLKPRGSPRYADKKRRSKLGSRRRLLRRQENLELVSNSRQLNFIPLNFKRSLQEGEEDFDFLNHDDVFAQRTSESFSDLSLTDSESSTKDNLENSLDDSASNSSSDASQVSEFQRRFQPAFRYFAEALSENIPYLKLERLAKCLSQLTCIVNQQAEKSGEKFSMSADDLLSSVILFLVHGHRDIVTSTYINLMFLQDYIPAFMENGKFGYTLTTFIGAFGAIMELFESNDKESPF
ncbi:hypothetical protein HOLleu_41890 [Holothuria leucospilota]|uniref:VPS9 domain-containing protein n=1 Tax=Holothuria leucospilota TaxID=206669 RepID=A0A9Q0YD30_HOLLE|nr:hypothetical protein HOLleu_41890 [Holothuria leucospilota]